MLYPFKIRDQTNSKTVAVEVFQAYKERRDMVERKGQKFANLIFAISVFQKLSIQQIRKKSIKIQKNTIFLMMKSQYSKELLLLVEPT